MNISVHAISPEAGLSHSRKPGTQDQEHFLQITRYGKPVMTGFLLLCLLAAASLSVKAQLFPVFTDNFNRAALSPGGTPATTYTTVLGGTSTIADSLVGSGNYVVNIKSGSTANKSYFWAPMSPYSSPFSLTLNANPGLVTWTFNMRTNLAVTTSTPTSGAISGGIDLCGNAAGNIYNGLPTGYGVVFNSGATGGVNLIKFSAGMLTNTTLITETTTMAAKTDYYSVRVTYNPATNQWSLYTRDDGTAAYADPSSGVNTQQGATIADSTYTSTAMVNFGAVYCFTAGTGKTMSVDNYMVSLPGCSGTPAPGNTLTSASNVCIGNTATLSLQNFTSGGGVTYQWSSAADVSGTPGTYSAITGATSTTYTTPALSATTWYRCAVGCPYSSATTNSTQTQIAVLPNPPAIGGGASTFCGGQPVTFTDVSTGGTWTSANYAIATIDPSLGTVIGLAAGATTISYIAPNGCVATTSVSINPFPTPVIITPATSYTVCPGGSVTATASSNAPTPTVLLSQNFNTSLAGQVGGTWTVVNTGGSSIYNWALASPPGYYDFTTYSIAVPGDGSQYLAADGDAAYPTDITTSLISPSFSTLGYTAGSVSLDLYVYSASGLDANAEIDYSTNGGSSWTQLTNYLGVHSPNANATWAVGTPNTTIPLPPGALGQSNVTLRWYYSSDDGYWWVVDNIVVSASPSPIPASAFTWSGPSGVSCTSGCYGATLTPSTAGVNVYTATATYGGCPLSGTISVNRETPVTVTAAATPNPVCLAGALTVNATPAGGSGTYTTYSWSGPGGFTASTQSAAITGMSATGAGVYSVSVTDNSGCSAASSGTTAPVTIASLPTVTATITPTAVCAGKTITVNATPAGGSGTYSSFTWSGPGGFTSSGQNTTRSGMSATGVGIYSVSVTDNNGCTSAAVGTTASVTLNALPTITATVTPTALCAGGTVTLNATPAGGGSSYTSYTWNGPGVFTASGQNTTRAAIPVAGSGIYSVTVTDNNGCTSVAGTTGTLTVNSLPTVTAVATPGIVCLGKTLTLNATPAGGSGNYTAFVWSGPSGYSTTGQNTNRSGIAATGAGIYSVSVTDNNGCTSAPAGTTASVTVASLPTITANATPAAVCVGYTLTLNGTPAGGSGTYSSYTWSGPGGFTATTQNPANPGMSASGVGIYSVSVTDNNGCTSAAVGTTASVTLNALPTITATVTPTALCAGGTVALSATPAGGSTIYTSYTWSGPGGFTASTQNAANNGITAAGAGTYSVTVTDNNGCTSLAGTTSAVTVNALPNLTGFSFPSSTAPCPGFASTVSVNASGLGNGTYTVTYNLIGANAATGHTASLTMASGGGIFTIPGSDLANSGTATLAVTSVTNSLGCNSALSAGNTTTVTVNPIPAPIGGTASVCLLSTITLTDASTGGAWSSNNTSIASVDPVAGAVTGSSVGTAIVTYTLPTGCITSVPVIVNPIPSFHTVTGGGTYCTGNPNIHIGLNGSDIGASYQVYVGGVATGGLVTGTGGILDLGLQTTVGTYTVEANPSATCAITMTNSVGVASTPSPNTYSVTGGGGYCAGGMGVPVGVSNSQGGTSYQLFNGTAVGSPVTGTGSLFSFGLNTVAGTYTVIATNTSNSCTTNMTGSAVVVINPVPPAITGTPVVCTGLTTALSDLVTGGIWSSSSLLAGVASVTGVVTGFLPTTSTITYTAAGCSASMQITVNPSPAAVTGVAAVCAGSTVVLSNATTGGAWSSSNTSVATVGATGTVTSIIAGPANIVYTLPAGCSSVLAITVNTQPGLISGSATLCSGSSSTLNDAVSGGTWSSSNTLVASVGPASGSVTGTGTGAAVVAYTLSSGCTANTIVTVNPTALISGPNGVCPGSVITLSTTTTGGAWANGGTATATVTSGTGIVSGVLAGTAAITYTTSASCVSAYPITVNSLPALKNVTGGGNYCMGGTGMHIGLNGSDAGISYQLFNGIIATGSPLSGTGSSLDFGLITASGTYSVVGTNTATGCSKTMNGGATITINPAPAVFAVSGGGNYCAGTSGVDVSLSGSVPGISYQLYDASVPVGSPVSGTGVSYDFGLQTLGGAYGVEATNPATGCYSIMSGSAIVNVLAAPAAYAVTGGGGYCTGGSGVHIYLSSSAAGTNYQLYNSGIPAGSAVPGTGTALDFGSLTTAGVYTVVGTNTVTSCSGPMSGSATITIISSPAVNAVTGGGGYCSGAASTSSVGLNGSVVGVSYQLYLGGVATGPAVAGSGSPFSFGIQSAAGTYTVVANPSTGCSAAMSGSASIVVNPLPNVYSVTGGGNYCTGSTSAVHVGLGGSDAGASYQLYNSGATVPGAVLTGTGTSLDFGALPAGSYTVGATSGAGCTANMSGSASIAANPLPSAFSVSITPAGNYCAGSPAPHILLSSSVVGVTYNLVLSGGIVGSLAGTGSSIDFGPQTASGSYSANAVSSVGCNSPMSGSATVVSNPLPAIYTATGGGAYCAGGAGKVVGLSGSGAGVSYQLYIGGVASGSAITGTGSAITFPSQTIVGSYAIVATSAASCISNMAGSVAVSTTPVPFSYNVTGGGAYCTGTTAGVHIGLSSSDPGISYQLFIGGTTAVGSPVPGTGSGLDFGAQAALGAYNVVATNTATFCTNNMFGSVTVSTASAPTAYAVSAGGSYCLGAGGLPVTLGNSDIGVNYQLLLGGVPLGGPVAGTGSPLNFGNQVAAGNYTVYATNATGCNGPMTGVDAISINLLPPVFLVTYTGTVYCAGDTGIHIGLSGSLTGYTYQLNNAGVSLGTALSGSGSTLDFGAHTSGVYTIVAANSATSCTNTMSGMIVVTANPLPVQYPVTGGGNYCSGGTGLDVGLGNSATGINYQLLLGSLPVGAPRAGTGSALHFGLQTASGSYTVIGTNTVTGCTKTMTGSATISASALPPLHTVSGGGNYCAGSAGTDVYLDGSNAGISYQLYNGAATAGTPLTGTGSAIHFGLQTAAGTYTVMATNGATCTNNMAGSVTVGISPLPSVYSVTGGGNYCPSGAGVHIGLSGSDATASYQLFNSSGPVGAAITGTGTSIDFGMQTVADIYTVTATNSATSCTNNMSGSAAIALYPLPLAHNITGGGSYCPGSSGKDIGLDGSDAGNTYQLYNGIVPAGAPLAGTGFAVDFGLQTASGIYTVIAASTATTCDNTMTGSAAISLYALPSVYPVSGGGNYCVGSAGADISLLSSDGGIHYQLFNDGVTVGPPVTGTGTSVNFGPQPAAGTYTVIATNATTSCTNNMSGSATVGISPLPAAYTVTGGGNYCSGGAGVDVGLSGSHAGITYRLYNGSAPAGAPLTGTGASLDFGIQSATGIYKVVATNASSSCTVNMSNNVIIGTNSLPAAYTVSASANQYCAGGTGVSLLLSHSDAGITYQLYAGSAPSGSPVSGTGLGLNFGLHTTVGVYTVVATNGATGCVNNMAGSPAISINPLPVSYTVAGGGNYCSGGDGVHIGLIGSDPGITYQLYDGATPAGSMAGTGFALDFGLQTNAGSYTVVAANPATACGNTMAGGATVGVSPLPAPYTVTGGGNYCASGSGVNVGLTGSASGISYQLRNGATGVGAPAFGSGSSLGFGLQTVAGAYTVVATDPATGCTNNMPGSAAVVINSLPAAYAVTGGGNYCVGGTGLHIGMLNSDPGIIYQLYSDATAVSTAIPGTGSPFDFGSFTAAGSYSVVATNVTTGCARNMPGTATIAVNAPPAVYTITGGGNYCAGAAGADIGLSNSNSGISYQLFNGSLPSGLPVAGSGSGIDFGLLSAVGTYSVAATNTATGCTSNMAGTTTVGVITPVTPTVTIPLGDTVCLGASVTINATVGNGGTEPVYYWTVNGEPMTATSGSFTYAPAVGDVVALTITSSAACATPATASASLSPTVLPHGLPVMTIAASPGDTVCQGTSVTFSSAIAYGGTAPAYSWMVNSAVHGTGSTLTYTPADGDVVYGVLTSNYRCRLATSVSSNNAVMAVDVPVTPSVAVSANPGTHVQQGQSVVLTAIVINNVIEPVFQWSLNGTPVAGATNSTYLVTAFTDLDSFACAVSSGGGCSGLKGAASVVLFANVGVAQVTASGSDITLVPNPNKGTFAIKGSLNTTADEEVSIELTDMLGQVVYKDKIIARAGTIDQKIQLANTVANGMYILNLRSASVNSIFHVVVEQ